MKKFSINKIKLKQILLDDKIAKLKVSWSNSTISLPHGDIVLTKKILELEAKHNQLTIISNAIKLYNKIQSQ